MKRKIQTVLFTVFVLSFVFCPFFIRVKVECKSQMDLCPKEVETKLSTLNNKSLFSARREVSKILVDNYLISNFSMQLKLPNILLVNVIVKQPRYSVFGKSENNYLLMDSNGYILSVSDRSNLPILIKENLNQKPGERISENDLFALKLIEGINQMYQVSSGTIQNDTLVVDMPLGIRVILPLSGYDTQVLLGSLRLIYTKATTDYIGVYSQIDMRFKNPVLR